MRLVLDTNVVLGTALAAKAEFIVTGDRTLRSLADARDTVPDFNPASRPRVRRGLP